MRPTHALRWRPRPRAHPYRRNFSEEPGHRPYGNTRHGQRATTGYIPDAPEQRVRSSITDRYRSPVVDAHRMLRTPPGLERTRQDRIESPQGLSEHLQNFNEMGEKLMRTKDAKDKWINMTQLQRTQWLITKGAKGVVNTTKNVSGRFHPQRVKNRLDSTLQRLFPGPSPPEAWNSMTEMDTFYRGAAHALGTTAFQHPPGTKNTPSEPAPLFHSVVLEATDVMKEGNTFRRKLLMFLDATSFVRFDRFGCVIVIGGILVDGPRRSTTFREHLEGRDHTKDEAVFLVILEGIDENCNPNLKPVILCPDNVCPNDKHSMVRTAIAEDPAAIQRIVDKFHETKAPAPSSADKHKAYMIYTNIRNKHKQKPQSTTA